MTVYTRGYRRFGGTLEVRKFRFGPIVAQGIRDAVASRAFRRLGVTILLMLVLVCFFLYFQSGPMKELMGMRGHATTRATDELDAAVARGFLAAALYTFHGWFTSLFVVLLTLFVGAGLVADDVKSRALPLYLIRPITSLDYFLGKFLVPMTVLAVVVLLPGLWLVLLAGLMRPTGHTLEFLLDQGDIVRTLFLHYLVLGVTYTSVVLLASTWTGRRIGAIVLGAVMFFGGGVLETFALGVGGSLGDALRSMSLTRDCLAVLVDGLSGAGFTPPNEQAFPSASGALIGPGVVFALCMWTVLRRARTTEVTA